MQVTVLLIIIFIIIIVVVMPSPDFWGCLFTQTVLMLGDITQDLRRIEVF